MNKIKKLLAIGLATVMAVSFASCGKTVTFNGAEVPPVDEVQFPAELSIFASKGASLMDNMPDYNSITSFKLLEEATGTHINWTIPPGTGFEEKFNLMIAGGSMTDIIINDWRTKGIETYIEDGVVFDMSPYAFEYMPNYTKFAKEHPDLARAYIYDGGKIFYPTYIRKDQRLNVFVGPLIRTDWLKKLNLKVPETADELYNVLKAFKTQDPNGNGKADEIPMSVCGSANDLGTTALFAMWNTANTFYVEDGKVKFGILEDNFVDAINYVAKLYAEGLIDPDYILQGRQALVGKINENRVGFAYEYQPSQIMTLQETKDPSFRFEGIPHFKSEIDGSKRTLNTAYTNSIVGRAAAITTACEDPFGAMKWLDFIYGDEGHVIMNFGKEGDTFNYVDGKVVYTDKVEKNTDGLTRSETWGKHFGTYNSYFPALQDWDCYGQYLNKFGSQAIETWSKDVVTDMNLPLLTFSEADTETIKNVYNAIKTYVDENVDKMIIGQVKTSKIPDIRKEIKARGIDDIIAIYQKAYDEYMNKDIGF